MTSATPLSTPSSTSDLPKKASRIAMIAAATTFTVGNLTSCSPSSSLQDTTIECFEKQGDLLAQITKKAKEAPNKAGWNAFTNVYDYLRESAGWYDNAWTDAEDGVTFTHDDVSYTISTRERKDGIQEFSIVWTSGLTNKKKQKVEGKQIYTFVDGKIRVKENDRPERVLTDDEFRKLSDFWWE